jgi:apolipoprotein N-acyltransferase
MNRDIIFVFLMGFIKKNRPFLLASLFSGILFGLAWPPLPLFFLLFIAFVPLLWIEDRLSGKEIMGSRLKVFLFTYLAFVIWNALTTYWLWFSTPGGCVFAILANAAFMSTVFLLYHVTKKQLGRNWGYLSLVAYWISYEFLHHRWELTWSWLSLGNAPALFPSWIQWYDITGVFGGSLWILLVNVLIFKAFLQYRNLQAMAQENLSEDMQYMKKVKSGVSVGFILFILIFPVIFSLIRFSRYKPAAKSIEAIAVQPNIDPYHEKFPGTDRFIPFPQQLKRLIELSAEKATSKIILLAWPETAIPGGLDEKRLEDFDQIKEIRQFMDKFPALNLLTGIDGYQLYGKEKKTVTARLNENAGIYFDYFNAAIQINNFKAIEVYHKSKLVPGVERMPYPGFFGLLADYAIDLGGITGSLGTQDERTVFFDQDSTGFAPVICFESVFGEYVGDYVKNGANVICIITNDGWWKKTAGHLQHLSFASLRAIETRRSIVRAANTGISCFVDERGVISQKTKYGEQAVIRGEITINNKITFYTKYGDVIGRVMLLLAIISLLLAFISKRTQQFFYRKNKF